MNIKSLVQAVLPTLKSADQIAAKKRTEAASTTDRDANGRQEQAGQGPWRHLNDDEIKKVISYLENLPGVKDNGLFVRLVEKDQMKMIYIEDASGKTVRRLSEADLFAVFQKVGDGADQKSSGNLLNKSA